MCWDLWPWAQLAELGARGADGEHMETAGATGHPMFADPSCDLLGRRFQQHWPWREQRCSVSLISHSHFFPASWPHPTAGLILTQICLDCLHLLLGPEELFSPVSVTGGSPDEGPL